MVMCFMIPGDPVGKGRPRLTTRGGYAHAYTPEKTAEYENKVKEAFLEQFSVTDKFGKDVPLKVQIDAYLRIPRSTSKTKAKDMQFRRIRPTKKPDADNIAKIILDALNGLAYEDDKQIVSLEVSKWYHPIPFVVVTVKEIKEGE